MWCGVWQAQDQRCNLHLMNKAYSLEDAFLNLDPSHPLTIEEREFYVERHHSQRQEMGQQLRFMLSRSNMHARFLFTGHRGSGKGTELVQLKSELDDQFFVALFSVTQKLDIRDLQYTDIIFAIGMGLIEAAEPALKNKIPDNLLDPIRLFFADVYTEKTTQEKFEMGAELKPSIFNLLTAFARLGKESTSRKTVRQKLNGILQQLINAIDDLARFIERETNKKIVVMVEDLDKLDVDGAQKLFLDHGKSLSDLPLHLIYTFPISLRHSNVFMQIEGYFTSFDLPNFKTHTRDNQNYDSGLLCLQEILTKRVTQALFDNDALKLLAEKSGGLVRHLLELTGDACIQATLKQRDKINVDDVNIAVGRLRATYSRFLTPEQKERLKEIHQTKTIENSEIDQGLLYNLSLLEYRNDDPNPWYDVHPVVQELL
jgi:hypothetical protein